MKLRARLTLNRFTCVLYVLITLAMSHADDNEYAKSHRADPALFQDVLHGTARAPAQYRIGVIKVASLLAARTHLPLHHWVPLIGLASALIAGLTLFSLLKRSAAWQGATGSQRWFAAAGFLFLAQYYFVWMTFYQRPETLPSAALVGLFFFLLAIRLPIRGSFSPLLTALAMLAVTVAQSFVRADVAIALNLGTLLFCLTSHSVGLSLTRKGQIATSAIGLAAAAAIQYVLQHRIYPNAVYGDTSRIQLFLNLKSPLEWPVFILFTVPFLWTLWAVFRRNISIEAPAKAMLVSASTFCLLWLIFGRMEEVRIFLPFALALAPITAGCAALVFTGDGLPNPGPQVEMPDDPGSCTYK